MPNSIQSSLLCLLAGLLASTVACSSDESASKPSTDDPAKVSPDPEKSDDDDDDKPDPKDDGPSADRSVKGTWEKVAVHITDGDPLEPLSGVFVKSAKEVYVVEGASNLGTGLYRYDGKAWTGVRYYGFAPELYLAGKDLIAFGTEMFRQASKDEWEQLAGPMSQAGGGRQVTSLFGTSLKSLFAATPGGPLKYNGKSWTELPESLGPYDGSFIGSSDTDVWYASPGRYEHDKHLAHYDGKSWTEHWTKLPKDVTESATGPGSLFMSSSDDVWVVANARTLIHYDGKKWSVVPGPDDEWGGDLGHGWASSAKNAWLTASGGKVFHWDGEAWESIPSGITENIYGIHGSDPENVWIVFNSENTALRLKPE